MGSHENRTGVDDLLAGDRSGAHPPRVVVGVSASHSGLAALRLAVRAAAARRASLCLVRVWPDISWVFPITAAEIIGLRDRERADAIVLAEAVEVTHAMDPGVPVISEFVLGNLYSTLHERTDGADLLVLGAGDDQTTSGLVGDWFRQHASCPVVVVDAEEHDVPADAGFARPFGIPPPRTSPGAGPTGRRSWRSHEASGAIAVGAVRRLSNVLQGKDA